MLSQYFFGILMFCTATFLILLVLVQRGRGGGLTGALGGMGGESAFGSKAGDLFTHITLWTAGFWIVLCMVTIAWYGPKTATTPTADGNTPAITGTTAGEDETSDETASDETGESETGEDDSDDS